MNCGVGCGHSLDLALLWLWCRPEATARMRPLAWDPPYATGAALEKTMCVCVRARVRARDELSDEVRENRDSSYFS